MKRQLWELSADELDQRIESTRRLLELNDERAIADHLAVLQEQREERRIEELFGGDAS